MESPQNSDSALKRWKDSLPSAALTWGIPVTGDAFVDLAIKHDIFGPEKSILELGPGYGRILNSLLSKNVKFKSYLGLDISKSNIDYLRSRFSNTQKDITFINGEFANTELNKSYDVILSSLTLKHLYPSFERALENICNYLNKNAILFFDLIENTDYNSVSDKMPSKAVWAKQDTYIAYYNKAEVEEILDRLSLKLVAYDSVVHHESKRPRLVVIAKQMKEGKAVMHEKRALSKDNTRSPSIDISISHLRANLNALQQESKARQEKIAQLQDELTKITKQASEEKAAIQGHLYSKWYTSRFTEQNISRMRRELVKFKRKPKISIIMPVSKLQPDHLKSGIESVAKQLYDKWELCICDYSGDAKTKKALSTMIRKNLQIRLISSKPKEGMAGAMNKALKIAKGDYLALLNQEDEISSDVLFEVVKAINSNPDADFIYTDEDKINENKEHIEPFFKPDWSPDFFLSMNYASHFGVIRRGLVREVGGFRSGFEGGHEYDLLLRITEKTSRIVHIHKVLYSSRKASENTAKQQAELLAIKDALERRRIDGTVAVGQSGFYRVKYNLRKHPLVSIIILNKNNAEVLKRCIESIKRKTTYDKYEVIIVDHSSTDKATLDYLDTLDYKVLKYEGKFNFSQMNNIGAQASSGQHFIFLNNDTEVIEPSWIEAMLEHSERKEVGAVGPKLFYPDDSIQHAGIIVGYGGTATNYEIPKNESGYYLLENAIRNVSGITAACVMVRKDVFESIKGFDEKMAHSWQDVDLCLRILKAGKLIVYTPYSTLYHITGSTRGRIDLSPEEKEANAYFRSKYPKLLDEGDPYYNRNFPLAGGVYLTSNFTFITDPMDLLMTVYYERPDLQKAYPEVQSGRYERLLEWTVNHGVKTDGARIHLAKFATYYNKLIEKKN